MGESFALYKYGDSSQPFYNAIDYSFGDLASGVIDSSGKLFTSGRGNYGALGNGLTSGYLGDYGNSGGYQYTFQDVLTAKDVSDASKANALPDDYQAVAVSAMHCLSLVLLDDGSLYGAGQQYSIGLSTTTTVQTHFTRLDGDRNGDDRGLPEATPDNKIKDIAVGTNRNVWVLYENGDLYMTSSDSATAGKWTLVASDIKMFDINCGYSTSGRVYAVNTSNQILSCAYNSTELEVLVEEPNGTVTQVRGSLTGGWGYLNSNNELYLSVTEAVYNAGTAPGATNNTPTQSEYFYKMENVAFFDLGGASSTMTYGVLYTNGSMTVWGDNTYGQLGNGTVGNTNNEATTPDAGLKDDVVFEEDEIPNVAEDEFTGSDDVVFTETPFQYCPPANK